MKDFKETKDILRIQGVKAKRYGIIPKLVMQDTRLSIESKAIYSYFRKHFKSLKDYAYIIVGQAKEKGKFSHNIYTLIDKPNIIATLKTPYPEIPDTENPSTKKSDTENPSTNNNKFLKVTKRENINTLDKNNTHKDSSRYISDTSVATLKFNIKLITGLDISETKIRELLNTSSLERIEYHLENWGIHKKNQVKNGAGYFITVIQNDIEPVEPENKYYNQNKIPQRDNFDQREYADEEMERYYANLTSD